MLIKELVMWLQKRARKTDKERAKESRSESEDEDEGRKMTSGTQRGREENNAAVAVSIGVICLYKAQAYLITKLLTDAGVDMGLKNYPSADLKPAASASAESKRNSGTAIDFYGSENLSTGFTSGPSSQVGYSSGFNSGPCSGSTSGSSSSSRPDLSSNGELRISTVDAFQVKDDTKLSVPLHHILVNDNFFSSLI